jgi:predicted RNase H-like HicB family nuclease
MMKMVGVPTEKSLRVCERRFTAILTPDPEEGGYSVACKEIAAAISQGETVQEAMDNIADAIELCVRAEAASPCNY